jgi:hypothetical protein
MEKVTQKLNKQKCNYPILAWYEADAKSKLMIISSAKEFKTIAQFNAGLSDLYKELEQIIDIDNLLNLASNGDDSIHSFAINEFSESKPNWDNLLNDVQAELLKFDSYLDLAEEIRNELLNNQKSDLAAGALRCVYSSILYTLITKALELGITEMMIIGDITFEEGLSSVIENNLPQHMTMSFLQL